MNPECYHVLCCLYVYMYMYLGYVFYFRDGVILYPKDAAFGILDFGMRIQEAK